VTDGVLRPDQDDASVLVEYNYQEVENIEFTIDDKNGVDASSEAVDAGERDNKNADDATSTGSLPDDIVRFESNASKLLMVCVTVVGFNARGQASGYPPYDSVKMPLYKIQRNSLLKTVQKESSTQS
jgi:hypothetical protein